MHCIFCNSTNVQKLNDEHYCLDCDHSYKPLKKGKFLQVQVTTVFNIPIGDGDKQHILWDPKDLTKYAREIIGHGVFRTAMTHHLMEAMKYCSEQGQAEAAGKKAKAHELGFQKYREDLYAELIRGARKRYKILQKPD